MLVHRTGLSGDHQSGTSLGPRSRTAAARSRSPIAEQQRRVLRLASGAVQGPRARIGGEQAHAIGLCDRLVPAERLREEAIALAAEIAKSTPLAIRSIR
jgi:enoyl-CoA hydratase/carnithine racemase